MKTFSAKKGEVEQKFFLFDANEQVVGRSASAIARILMGKHKPVYTPHVDTGDYVVVINADKAKLTGKKETDKLYWHHTGFPGGERSVTAERMRAEKPEEILKHAVSGMLPKGPLGRAMYRKLKVYAGPEHPHAAQKPEPMTF